MKTLQECKDESVEGEEYDSWEQFKFNVGFPVIEKRMDEAVELYAQQFKEEIQRKDEEFQLLNESFHQAFELWGGVSQENSILYAKITSLESELVKAKDLIHELTNPSHGNICAPIETQAHFQFNKVFNPKEPLIQTGATTFIPMKKQVSQTYRFGDDLDIESRKCLYIGIQNEKPIFWDKIKNEIVIGYSQNPNNMKKKNDHDLGFGVDFTEEDIRDSRSNLIEGLLSTPTLLGAALLWLIIATVCIYFGAILIGHILIGFASALVLIWVAFRALPVAWRWFINLV